MDPSSWPEMDSQPLSLEDCGRLRVVSAKVYSIVRNRDIEHFEKVLNFLEETYRLLPRLVAPIKHMKIVFGLKTMVWWEVVVKFICVEFLHTQSVPSEWFCVFVYNVSSILSPLTGNCFLAAHYVDAEAGKRSDWHHVQNQSVLSK